MRSLFSRELLSSASFNCNQCIFIFRAPLIIIPPIIDPTCINGPSYDKTFITRNLKLCIFPYNCTFYSQGHFQPYKLYTTHPRTFPNFFKNIAPESFVGDKIGIVEVILLLFLMMSNLENPTYFSSS